MLLCFRWPFLIYLGFECLCGCFCNAWLRCILRERLGIAGTFCEDLAVHTCANRCGRCQESMEMSAHGYTGVCGDRHDGEGAAGLFEPVVRPLRPISLGDADAPVPGLSEPRWVPVVQGQAAPAASLDVPLLERQQGQGAQGRGGGQTAARPAYPPAPQPEPAGSVQ